jgi:hypothetical protein
MQTVVMRRLSGAAVGLALGVGGLAAPAAVAATPTSPTPEAAAASTWLARVIGSDGLIPGGGLNGSFYGANLDFGVGLALTGQVPSASFSKLNTGIDDTIAAYVGDIADPANAGRVARAAYYYAVTGQDATSAGSQHLDLAAALEADVDDTTGQLGTTDSTYNQVWAVFALHALSSAETAKARDFLVSERGPAGSDGWGYEDTWSTPGSTTFVNDSDATSWALQALSPWQGDAGTAPAISAGVAYLKSRQNAAGGVEADYLGINANSTGLAATAFGQVGEAASATKAATWLADHQVVSLPGCSVTSNSGAVAYDDAAFANGVTNDSLEQAATATAQAISGLAYVPRTTARISAPTGFVQAGGRITVQISGLRAGQQACLTGGTTAVRVSGPGARVVTLPAGTATRTLRVSSLATSASVPVKVLGATTLKIVKKAKAKRGTKVKVTIRGLAAGERAVLRLRGKKVAAATVGTTGTLVVKIKIAKKAKLGKAKLTVSGAFSNRAGQTTLRVTR